MKHILLIFFLFSTSCLYGYSKSVYQYKNVQLKNYHTDNPLHYGDSYFSKSVFDTAAFYYMPGIHLYDSLNNRQGLLKTYYQLGWCYKQMNNAAYSFNLFNLAFTLSQKLNADSTTLNCLNQLIELSTTKGDVTSLGYYQQQLVAFNDSLEKKALKNTLALNDSVINQQKDSIEQFKKKELELNENNNQLKKNNLLALIACGILLIAGFITAILIKTRSSKKIHQLNNDNESLKKETEINNKQLVTVSAETNEFKKEHLTYYASIQKQLLPLTENITKSHPESFVLYQNKEGAGGDFYWFTDIRISREKGFKGIYLIAVDCNQTGLKGVGLTTLINDLLNTVIKEKGIYQPGAILNQLNQNLCNLPADMRGAKPLVAASISCLNIERNEINFAGAQFPLYVIRNKKVYEIEGTKEYLGQQHQPNQPFQNNLVEVKEGDFVYLFTDGWFKQLTEKDGKEIGPERIKDLLIRISDKTMAEQKKEIHSFILEESGRLPQTDDILVMGYKI